MQTKSKWTGLLLVMVGVVIGALVFSNLNSSTEPKAFSAPGMKMQTESQVEPASDRAVASLKDLNDAFVEIAEKVNPAVVTVYTEKFLRIRSPFSSPFLFDPFREFFGDDFFGPRNRRQQPEEELRRQQGHGSGVIVSPEGYIVTNNHVVDEADSIYVRIMGRQTYPATVIGVDPKTDVAVIKIEAENLTAIPRGDSDRLRVGEWVLAIGSPLSDNLAHTVTQGIVSAKGRSRVGLAEYEDFIQTDAAINPGNSGGALVNLDGELVGINTAIASRSGGFQGIGFAVPVNMVSQVMEALIEHGRVVRGWLGVSIQDVNEPMAEALNLDSVEGVLVGDVVEGSPADKAGFQDEDVIVGLNGDKIVNSNQLRNTVASIAPGTRVTIDILRGGSKKQLAVTLGELPDDPRAPLAGTPPAISKDLLGFSAATLTDDLARRYRLEQDQAGVVVTDVDPKSAAARAGLRVGDLIRKINRKRVENITDFNEVAKNLKRGDSVLIQVARQGGSFYLAFEIQ